MRDQPESSSETPWVLPRSATDAELVAGVVDHYHAALKRTTRALAVLRTWRLDHPALIDAHGLGFADRSLGHHLPSGDRMVGAVLRGRLLRLGLLRPSGHERFRGALTVPIRDGAGQLIDLYGRKTERKLRPDSPREVFLTERPTHLFNPSALRLSSELILCGSILDALTVWSAGLFNVVGLTGTPPQDFATRCADAGVARVILALPRDFPSDRLAGKFARQLAAHGIEARRLRLPRGVTVNAFVRPTLKAADVLREAIRRAPPMAVAFAPVEVPHHVIA